MSIIDQVDTGIVCGFLTCVALSAVAYDLAGSGINGAGVCIVVSTSWSSWAETGAALLPGPQHRVSIETIHAPDVEGYTVTLQCTVRTYVIQRVNVLA